MLLLAHVRRCVCICALVRVLAPSQWQAVLQSEGSGWAVLLLRRAVRQEDGLSEETTTHVGPLLLRTEAAPAGTISRGLITVEFGSEMTVDQSITQIPSIISLI